MDEFWSRVLAEAIEDGHLPVRALGPCPACGCDLEGCNTMWSLDLDALVCRLCGEVERLDEEAA